MPNVEQRIPKDEGSHGGQTGALLTGCVDAGLAGAIFVVPLILGGRIALGQLVLVSLAVWVSVCWCLRQSCASQGAWTRSAAGPLVLLAVVLVSLQLVPLSPSVLGAVSPHLGEVLPLWTASADGSATMGTWDTLSLTPIATRNALILLIAVALLMLITVQRVQRIEDVERLLRWIAISTLVIAAFGLVQYLTSNGKFFWFYEHPFTDTEHVVKGSFTNRNHFAQFIAVGIGPLLWWLQSVLVRRGSGKASEHRPLGRHREGQELKVGLWIIGFGICVFAALMSLSRGGTMALIAALVVCVAIFYRGSLIGRRALGGVLGIGVLLGAFLAIHGYELVAARLDDFGSIEELDRGGRLRLWEADAVAIGDYRLAGTGLGSHREVCPMYLQNECTSSGLEYTHAENGLIQIAMETGIAGLLLALAAMGLCVFWCVAPLRRGVSTRVLLCVAAIAAGLAANFVHSLTDFVWYVPGCMVPVAVLAACACRLWQMTRAERGISASLLRISRVGWLAAAGCLLVVGFFMAENRWAAMWAELSWNRYVALSKQFEQLDEKDQPAALSTGGEALSSVIKWEPDCARAHARLAAVHLGCFNHPPNASDIVMDVRQVREAVLASRFESPSALGAWLSKAFGDRRKHLDAALYHARCAASLCPLQGEAYVLLADLSFLEGPNSPGKAAYIEQALRVRPGDGDVLFAAGQEAMLAGNIDDAVQYWHRSAKVGAVHQQRLLKVLMPQLPAAAVVEIVQPDLAGLRQMSRYYRTVKREADLRVIRIRLAATIEDQARAIHGTEATKYWLDAARAHRQLDNLPESLRCLRAAVDNDPSSYEARHGLGRCLLELKMFDEARTHLTWCVQRNPREEGLRGQLEAAVDGQLRVTTRASAGDR